MADLPELPMRVFRAEVVRVEDLTPSMRRVVLCGAGLTGFETTGVGDEYLRVLFPAAGETEPKLPLVENNVFDYSAIDLNLLRTYTVRAFDREAGEVTLEFVVHQGGVASTWARSAKPGDVVGINTPSGMYDPPADLAWQILIADCAGLPAAARLLEQTPAEVRTRLVLEVPDQEHRVALPEHPRADVAWIHGGNGQSQSRLVEVVSSLPKPPGAGYIWVSGESKTLRGVRRVLRKEFGLPASSYKAVGYWIEGAEDWNAKYDALDAATRGSLQSLWESDRAEEEIEDEYDERLSALGL